MADNFNELMQKFVNSDYEDLVKMGQAALSKLLPVCKKVDPDHDGFMMITSIILSAVGADGVLSALEKKFMHDTLGLDDATISKYIKMYDSKMIELTDHFVDNLGAEVKADTLILVTAIAAVDEKICKEETALIRKLLA